VPSSSQRSCHFFSIFITSKGRAISTFYGLAVTPPVGKDDDVSSPTYILVHGAWGGAWCWRDVGVELDQRGVAWRAVDLPSSRNDAGPQTGLAEDAEAVAALANDDGPYVLVAIVMAARSRRKLPREYKTFKSAST